MASSAAAPAPQSRWRTRCGRAGREFDHCCHRHLSSSVFSFLLLFFCRKRRWQRRGKWPNGEFAVNHLPLWSADKQVPAAPPTSLCSKRACVCELSFLFNAVSDWEKAGARQELRVFVRSSQRLVRGGAPSWNCSSYLWVEPLTLSPERLECNTHL